MSEKTQINSLPLTQINNAEFYMFSQETINNLLNAGLTKLGVSKTMFDPYSANNAVMGDIVSQSRISVETAQIAEADAKCDALLNYYFLRLDAGIHSPVEADRAAYIALNDATRIYRGITALAQKQQIAQTHGLVHDAGKEENAKHIIALGLTTLIQAINDANVEYALLLDKRLDSQLGRELPDARAIRREMIGQYNRMMTVIVASHMTDPTEDTEKFIRTQNKLIADTTARYHLRMGIIHANRREKQAAKAETAEKRLKDSIIALEEEALKLWNLGDPDGFIALSADEIIYIDPALENKLEGKKALEEYYNPIRGKIKIDRYRMINPVVQLSSEVAVLTYDYEVHRDGTVVNMGCTEVYRLNPAGQWRIIHTHWSFCKPG